MDRNQVRLEVLKKLGRVPQNAVLNSRGEIVDDRGRPVEIRGDDGGPATAEDLRDIEAIVDEEFAKREEAAAGERGALPLDLRRSDPTGEENPEAARTPIVEAEVAQMIQEGAGIDLTPYLSAIQSSTKGTYFGGVKIKADDGVSIIPANQRGPEDPVGFQPGFGSGQEYPRPFLPQPQRPGPAATPGSGAHHRDAEEAYKPTETRVPTEVFANLNKQQQEMLPIIFEEASRNGLDPALLFGLLYTESRLNPNVSSPTNDHGIAQINIRSLQDIGKTIAWAKDPRNGIAYAARRLSRAISKYGSVAAALVEYNGGQGNADKYVNSGKWPYARAEQYVKSILDVSAQFNPNGVYDMDGPDPSTELPHFTAKVTNPTDIKARAREVGRSVLGRAPNKSEMKLLVAAVQNGQQSSQIDAQYAAFMAEEGVGGSSADWAKFENGRIPQEALAPIGGGHFLRPDAAAAWQKMVAAAARDGVTITLTDSYRDYATQVETARKKGLYSQGGLAAEPGESNHGWGLAVDVDQGREWLAKNASKFGFSTIAREPWHWEYKGDKHWTGGVGMGTTTMVEPASVDAIIAEELEALNPEEAHATKFASQVGQLLEILDRPNPYRTR